MHRQYQFPKIEIENKVIEIYHKLIESDKNNRYQIDCSIIDGVISELIFIEHFKKANKNIENSPISQNQIDKVYADKAKKLKKYIEYNFGRLNLTYSTGLSGILCFLSLSGEVKNEIELELDVEELLVLYDNSILIDLRKKDIDFFVGSTGKIFSLLTLPNNETINRSLQKYLEKLKPIVFDFFTNSKADFGVPHGISSLCLILIKIFKKNENSIAAECIRHILSSILKYKNSTTLDSLYPSIAENEGYSRLGWCYGDLGIGLCFWHAGKALDDNEYKNEAFDIFKFNITRKDLNKNYVYDACICHGTAGISQIFNRMYVETNKLEFREISNYWVNQTLNLANKTDGLCGYKTYCGDNWLNNYGMLEGITGIGLGLMSSLDSHNSSWDKYFLIS